ncbi:MFS transporter [Tumebacillus sp. DT12]|uniref:MFS transporter n=1 Tax=Tumebacillus lacus TaxID=2995335 RepID=A0ABT3X385_9BACL|nr:MFS transporter [Tumebacillus lacus]MCX7570025.1 MFS transporter [Tumebacillus lacus]
MKSEWSLYRELLARRDFTVYVFAYYLASFGSVMTLFAIWAQIYQLHQNAMALGVATILEILPGILIAPYAGLLADRMSKRTLLIAAFVLRGLTVAGMFFSTELWQLFVLVGLHSTFGAFEQPPHRALLPLLVRPDQYVTMNAFLATLNNFLQIFKPALAGALVGALGYKMAYAIDFWTYFLPAAALLLIRVKDVSAERGEDGAPQPGMWQEVREGVAYIRTEPILVYIFIFMMCFTLAMGMQGTLTYVFVDQHLASPDEVSSVTGILFSALGIGGLIGAFFTPRLIRRMNMLWLLFGSLAFDGCLVVLFSMSQTVWLAVSCFALFGIVNSVTQIVQDTLIQTIVPEGMRGRVYGAFGPITGPISLLSISTGTSLSTVIGVRAMFLIAGLMEILTVLFCRLLPMYQSVRASLQRVTFR